MQLFTIHRPTADPASADADTRFVRDGFSWWALLFGPLWLIWHRLWLALLATIVVSVAIALVLAALGANEVLHWLAQSVVTLGLGIAGNDLLRLGLSRRGFAEVGLVAGDTIDDCEQRYFGGRGARPAKVSGAAA